MPTAPTLCFDGSAEGQSALRLLQRSGIPFHFWDADVVPSTVGAPPFLNYGSKTYVGLERIQAFVEAYPGLRDAEDLLLRYMNNAP